MLLLSLSFLQLLQLGNFNSSEHALHLSFTTMNPLLHISQTGRPLVSAWQIKQLTSKFALLHEMH